MNAKFPSRIALVLPVTALLGAGAFVFLNGSAPAGSVRQHPSSIASKPASLVLPACCQKIPSRAALFSKYAVKFQGVNAAGVDYDAGNTVLEIVCRFEDLNAEQPVVGISELGIVTRLQTDNGSLFESNAELGIIKPEITDFKNAQFLLRSKIPMQTHRVNLLHGSITVLRACSRASMTWREPFGAEIGSMKRSSGFEMTLTKFSIANDTATVQWSCNTPLDALREDNLWQRRHLKATLTCADKTVLNPEASAETRSAIHRVFRLNKKFPVALELNFICDLRTENLPFTLTDISLDGSKDDSSKKSGEASSGQNF
jgi:hypothetical protein